MNTLRTLRLSNTIPRITLTTHYRALSTGPRRLAEGDTGATRSRGQAGGDSWTRREKAAEDMYIKEREKAIVALLREKIAKQEEQLAKDLAMLAAMEDQYGNVTEQGGR